MPIRKGIDAQPTENFRFQALHCLGFGVVFVVVAEEMQKTVHDEMLNVLNGWNPALPGFPSDGL